MLRVCSSGRGYPLPCLRVLRGVRLGYILLYVPNVGPEHRIGAPAAHWILYGRLFSALPRYPAQPGQRARAFERARVFGGLASVGRARIFGGLGSVGRGGISGRLMVASGQMPTLAEV